MKPRAKPADALASAAVPEGHVRLAAPADLTALTHDGTTYAAEGGALVVPHAVADTALAFGCTMPDADA